MALATVSPGNLSSSQMQSRNSSRGQSSTSSQITGLSESLPWSCQVPLGVMIRSPREAGQRSPSMVVKPPSSDRMVRLALGVCMWAVAWSPGL